MSSPEFEEILGSVQDLVKKSYAQGRRDALKQVVKVMQDDETAATKPLALNAPAEGAAPAEAKTGDSTVSPGAMEQDTRPWWVRLH